MNKGYVMNLGNIDFFYQTEAKIKTKAVIDAFIEQIGKVKGFSKDVIEQFKNHEPTVKDLRYRITAATLTEKHLTNMTSYSIEGKNFSWNFPEADFKNDVILFK